MIKRETNFLENSGYLTDDNPIVVQLIEAGFSKKKIEEAIRNEVSIEYEKLSSYLTKGI